MPNALKILVSWTESALITKLFFLLPFPFSEQKLKVERREDEESARMEAGKVADSSAPPDNGLTVDSC